MDIKSRKYLNRVIDMENINSQKTATFSTIVLVVGGLVFALVSLLGYSFIFGFVGVIMGILATKNGSKAGLTVIIVNMIFMAIGLIFSEIIADYIMNLIS
ncbi:hypothetical protein [Acetivibrio saccincola]|nr:hypothetical protein [Acetivibrio saccincola]HQD29019.1 hypothetical protein [Acetivibrio saccincola]